MVPIIINNLNTKNAASLQPPNAETFLSVKMCYFDEFNDMPQGKCFHKKKSGSQLFEAFKRAQGLLRWPKKLV